MSELTDTRWLRPCAGHWRQGAGPVLLCLPHAGGGALSYAGWDCHPLGGFEPVAVCPPGREDRFAEDPVTGWGALVSAIADSLTPLARRPLAVFGHSMGALTGYELLRELARRGRPTPLIFAASAHRAPQEMPTKSGPPRSTRELLDYVRRLDHSGTAELLNDPEWRDLVLQPLGADLRLHDTYRLHAEPPGQPLLSTPFVVLAGEDDLTVSERTYAGWSALTRGACVRRVYPGGHFYLREHRDRFLTELGRDLENAMRGELR
ncbi:thioesterase II family protein [Streptosporangium sp. NPDC050855]|uniref:thioesterase II family protein n=1 Tax=Streptosporangium sp. NPDC050855 TaxID=3366194 RepID=UPI0037B6AD33